MFGSNCAATTEVKVTDRYVLPGNFFPWLDKDGGKK